MDPTIRLLVVATTGEEGERLVALVKRCDLPSVAARRVSWEGAALAARAGDADVLLVACPDDPAELVPLLDVGIPAVLVAPAYTEALATLAHRSGALVCLESHGPAPLRWAILQAADLRRRDDAMRASEQVRALVNTSVADVIFQLGIEGDRFRFLEVNPMFIRATGLSEAQVVGKLVDEVIPEPSLSMVLARYREAVAERRTVRWDEVTPYPTGKKYGEVSITPLIDAGGRCTRLVGTVHDVTEERVQAHTIKLYADIVRAVRIGLTVWEVGDPEDPGAATLVGFNPRAEGTLDLSDKMGKPLQEIFPSAAHGALLGLITEVARLHADRELRELRMTSGPYAGRTFGIKAFPLEGGRVGLAVEEVTDLARARALAVAEGRVLEMVAEGASLERSLTVLAQAIEAQAPPALASVLLLSEDGQRLYTGAAPSLPPDYCRALDGAPIGPNAGSCGTAAVTKLPVIVEDILEDPLWEDYRDLARASGMRACWSMPIMTADDRVLGTFALYYREPRFPTPADLDLIARASHVAAIGIQRKELDDQLRGLSARVEAAREDERTGIAREIHDQLGQTITALKLDLAWIARRAGSLVLAPETLLEKISALSRLTDDMIAQVRRISAELRPGILDDVGLVAALSWQAQDFEERSHIVCELRSSVVDDRRLPRPLATTVFRVFQEALTNVLRHAAASHVAARLQEDAGALVFEVEDDGTGISAERIHDPRSLGLLGIRERARRLGGSASFARGTGGGTVVMLRLPIATA